MIIPRIFFQRSVYIILEVRQVEGVVELVLPNVRSGRSALTNGKYPMFFLKEQCIEDIHLNCGNETN